MKAEGWFYLGLSHAALGNTDSAATAYQRASEFDPLNPVAVENLASLYSAAHRWHAATSARLRVLALPSHTGTAQASRHAALGKALFRVADPGGAAYHFAAAISLDPSNPSLRYELGRSNELFTQAPYTAADTNFTAALKLSWKAIQEGRWLRRLPQPLQAHV
jgi:Flp pilus assembly protein TadD